MQHFIATLCCALAMIATAFPAYANLDFDADGLHYTLLSEEEGTVTVDRIDNSIEADLVIPQKVTYDGRTYSVTAISDRAFYNCRHLTSVNIPESITSIGEEAFRMCDNLTSITIPNSVEYIGDYAFVECSIMENICVDTDNPTYSSVDGLLMSKDQTKLITCPEGKNCDLTIPNTVTSIEKYSFFNCNLKSVIIPASVTTIGEDAFYYSFNLTKVTIPASVISIGIRAFADCPMLQNISVDPENQFYSSVDGLLLSKDQTKFIQCPGARSHITIPDCVTSIEGYSFITYKLKSVNIPSSVTTICDRGFWQCSGITTVDIPNSVTSIGERAFEYCRALTSVSLPNSITSIESITFGGCWSLESIDIPQSVTSIGEFVFSNCSNLASITLPNSVTSIGTGAFGNCTSLSTIENQSKTPVECTPHFREEIYSTATLYIPTGTLASYRKVAPWMNFLNIAEKEFNGINGTSAEGKPSPMITVIGGTVIISGIAGDESISICDMQGRTVYNGTEKDITGLAPGIYVLKAGSGTIKFAI